MSVDVGVLVAVAVGVSVGVEVGVGVTVGVEVSVGVLVEVGVGVGSQYIPSAVTEKLSNATVVLRVSFCAQIPNHILVSLVEHDAEWIVVHSAPSRK